MDTSILSRPELVWFIIGLALFLLELVIPGFVIFFFGIGAWITALLCLIAEPDINVQVIVFAIASVASLFAFRRMIRRKFFYDKNAQSEEVEDEFTGKEAIATVNFGEDKQGKVEFKGTTWKAESQSPVVTGQRVRIINKENIKLIVEPIN